MLESLHPNPDLTWGIPPSDRDGLDEEAVTMRSFVADYISFVSVSMKSASWLCGIAGVSVRLKPLVQIRPLQDPAFFTHLQDCDLSFLNFPSGEYRRRRYDIN